MLILASSSPFRKELLERLGIEFSCHAPDIDEDTLKSSGLGPKEISQMLSTQKAMEVLKLYPEAIIIGSDQVLNFNEEILGKPGNKENAKEQLVRLSGKTHELITSFTVMNKDKSITETVSAKMKMKELSQQQIDKYLEADEPYGCCGSYKLERLGIALFSEVNCCDHTAIVGLPLIKLISTLEKFGIKAI